MKDIQIDSGKCDEYLKNPDHFKLLKFLSGKVKPKVSKKLSKISLTINRKQGGHYDTKNNSIQIKQNKNITPDNSIQELKNHSIQEESSLILSPPPPAPTAPAKISKSTHHKDSSNAPQDRSSLLKDICSGKKLKITITNDRSKPIL